MPSTRAAIRYAKAILSVATDNQTSEKIQLEMDQIARAIDSNTVLNEALKSPVVKLSEKAAILDKIFNNSSPELKSLFQTLAENKRIDLLRDIALKFKQLYDQLNNKEEATVTTAVPMTLAMEAKVMAKLKTLSSKDLS